MPETLVKICGLTNLEDTLTAIEMGADLLGFNFYPESPRFMDYPLAKTIFQEIPPSIPKVGVFVNEYYQNIIDLVQDLELDYIQFHGDESPEFCNQMGHPWFKALRLELEGSLDHLDQYECEWILADAFVAGQYGGTGEKPDWQLAKKIEQSRKKLILAGGLNPQNVQLAIATVKPFAVDVASGVEAHVGKKDLAKMEEFINKAKKARLHMISPS
ncbi:MAG: phosphoribosylanthranilate isomerase [Deltaproteobacteria bacterium]|nr:phosphoribosylanthranilate isomerase [Deltaproteobacteria bacterium]